MLCIVIEEILKDEHEVTGVKLSVEVMDEEEEEPALATIMIDGITSKIDEDNLEMYFSSKRKSGGGEIESGGVQIDETKGYVTFCDPQGSVAITLYCVTIATTLVFVHELYICPNTGMAEQPLR